MHFDTPGSQPLECNYNTCIDLGIPKNPCENRRLTQQLIAVQLPQQPSDRGRTAHLKLIVN